LQHKGGPAGQARQRDDPDRHVRALRLRCLGRRHLGDQQQPPQPVVGGQLNGVTATAGPAWAVGYANAASGTATLFMHWSGGKWHRLKSKSPGGPDDLNSLVGVSGTSCHTLWAAGWYAPFEGSTTGITARC
jgi:hypothetical protein